MRALHRFPRLLLNAVVADTDGVAIHLRLVALFDRAQRRAMAGRRVAGIVEGIGAAAGAEQQRECDRDSPDHSPVSSAASAGCGVSNPCTSASSSCRYWPRARLLSSATGPTDTRSTRLTSTPWRSNSWRMSLPLAPRATIEY